MKKNFQENTWSSNFGQDYTDRNILNPKLLDEEYLNWYGVTRTEMNESFLGEIGLKEKKILEMGCNIGNQLALLQNMGYQNLYGIELQWYAVEKAKSLTKEINIIQSAGDDIPFKGGYFDLVFTSGVLIHISPEKIGRILDEIYRCSKKYIWGFEYYADMYTEIVYRGNKNLLWKTNFAKLYLDRFPDLELVKEEKFKYSGEENVDSMFLLKKK